MNQLRRADPIYEEEDIISALSDTACFSTHKDVNGFPSWTSVKTLGVTNTFNLKFVWMRCRIADFRL